MKIYISHPYGSKVENKEKIEKIIRDLIFEKPQHTYVSPVHCFGFLYEEVEYDIGIRYCLDLLDACDEMWVFGDYANSKGCKLEIVHALETKKPFYIK